MNSTAPWQVLAEARAQKVLARAPRPERDRLQAALDDMERDPFAGDVARPYNQLSAFRRRVGDWRIFFDVYPETRLVRVRAIERRTSTTYRQRH